MIIKILIVFLLILLINNISYCDSRDVLEGFAPGGGRVDLPTPSGSMPSPDSGGDGKVVNPDEFDPSSSTGSNTLADNIIKTILGGVQGIGSIVSVLALVIIGVKYMLGSVEEKAEYKKTLMPYIIGAGLVFAASAIATVVYNFASSVNIA